MCGFPFLLANIEMVVACGAAPIDPPRRLTRHEPAILPEILARSGAAAAVEPVDDGGSDATRLQDQPRHLGGKFAAGTDGVWNGCGVVKRRCVLGHRLSD